MPRYAIGTFLGLVGSALLFALLQKLVFPLSGIPADTLSQRGVLLMGASAGFLVGLFWEGRRKG
jgi:hypothetical protein